MSGTLFVVATPIGNLEDISARALRVLREAALIAAEDTRRTQHLLARYAITTPTTSLHEHNETQKVPALLDRLKRGEHVAVVSDAGTPTVSDPGRRLVRAAIDAGIRVEPVPGPSAVLAAVAASGFEGDSFMFLGFPPTKGRERKEWLARLGNVADLAVFFEAPHRIVRTLDDVRRTIGDCDVAVGREITKVHEQFLRGPVSEVLEGLESPVGEFTVVADIGHMTINRIPVPAVAADLASELGQITNNCGLTKREAIAKLAQRHGMTVNAIYDLLEQAKKSGK